MGSQYPYDNYSQNPDSSDNQGQNPPYSPGYAQQFPPTQYSQPDAYPPPPQYEQPSSYPPQYPQSDPYAPPPQYQQASMYPPPAYSAYAAPAATPDRGMGFAIAGLVLGIIAVLSSWIPFCGLPIPIVGIVLSALARGRSVTPSYRTMALVGLILSIVAIAISLLITIVALSHSYSTPSQ